MLKSRTFLNSTCLKLADSVRALLRCIHALIRKSEETDRIRNCRLFWEWLPHLYFMGLGLDMSQKESIKVLNYRAAETLSDTFYGDDQEYPWYIFLTYQVMPANFVA